ncbi:MAG: hypothetical protein AB7Q17_00340 [Phycisphaerae bacterium]
MRTRLIGSVAICSLVALPAITASAQDAASGPATAAAATPAPAEVIRLSAGLREYPARALRALLELGDEPRILEQVAAEPSLLEKPEQFNPTITAGQQAALRDLAADPAIIAIAAEQLDALAALTRLHKESPQKLEELVMKLRSAYRDAQLAATSTWDEMLDKDAGMLAAYEELVTRFCREQRKQFEQFPVVQVIDKAYYRAAPPDEVLLEFAREQSVPADLRRAMERWLDEYAPDKLDDWVQVKKRAPSSTRPADKTLAAAPASQRAPMWKPLETAASEDAALLPVMMQPLEDRPGAARFAYAVTEHARLWEPQGELIANAELPPVGETVPPVAGETQERDSELGPVASVDTDVSPPDEPLVTIGGEPPPMIVDDSPYSEAPPVAATEAPPQDVAGEPRPPYIGEDGVDYRYIDYPNEVDDAGFDYAERRYVPAYTDYVVEYDDVDYYPAYVSGVVSYGYYPALFYPTYYPSAVYCPRYYASPLFAGCYPYVYHRPVSCRDGVRIRIGTLPSCDRRYAFGYVGPSGGSYVVGSFGSRYYPRTASGVGQPYYYRSARQTLAASTNRFITQRDRRVGVGRSGLVDSIGRAGRVGNDGRVSGEASRFVRSNTARQPAVRVSPGSTDQRPVAARPRPFPTSGNQSGPVRTPWQAGTSRVDGQRGVDGRRNIDADRIIPRTPRSADTVAPPQRRSLDLGNTDVRRLTPRTPGSVGGVSGAEPRRIGPSATTRRDGSPPAIRNGVPPQSIRPTPPASTGGRTPTQASPFNLGGSRVAAPPASRGASRSGLGATLAPRSAPRSTIAPRTSVGQLRSTSTPRASMPRMGASSVRSAPRMAAPSRSFSGSRAPSRAVAPRGGTPTRVRRP